MSPDGFKYFARAKKFGYEIIQWDYLLFKLTSVSLSSQYFPCPCLPLKNGDWKMLKTVFVTFHFYRMPRWGFESKKCTTKNDVYI